MNTEEVRAIIKRNIRKAASVEAGWLDGAGSSVPEQVRGRAEAFIDAQDFFTDHFPAFPMEEGGISLELDIGDWSLCIEFLPDGSNTFHGIDAVRTTFFHSYSADEDAKFLREVKEKMLSVSEKNI